MIESTLKLAQEKILSWIQDIALLVPDVFITILVLVVFFFLAKMLSVYFNNLLSRYFENRELINFFSIVLRVLILLCGLFVAVSSLHMDRIIFSFLAGAGFVGIALGFAFQDLATNLISGVALVMKKDYPFKRGDLIETNGFKGNVKDIYLRNTLIKTFQGQHILIPNKLIFEKPLINYNMTRERRVDLKVGISYGEDLQKVKDVTINALKDLEYLIEEYEVELFFEEFGDSSINFQVRFWIHYENQNEYLVSRSDAVMKIKKAFNENGITIPFPIRTLDFGIKGGTKLSEMIDK